MTMNWKKQFNGLFTDSFFRFLFGFTIIIATSFGIIIVADIIGGGNQQGVQITATEE